MTGKLSVLGLMLLSVGCAKTESDDLLTSGMWAGFEARATGDGSTTVYATLYVDNPATLNFVELGDDDHLVVTSGGTMKTMSQSELGNLVSNAATFTGDAGGTEFDIAFDREVDAGAPSSTISLPPPFAVDPPPTSASRAAALTLTWAPEGSGDEMRWDASGTCIASQTGSTGGDAGSYTLPAGALVKAPGTGGADSCMVTFTLTLQRHGELDEHFTRGGEALGTQVRTVTWTTTP